MKKLISLFFSLIILFAQTPSELMNLYAKQGEDEGIGSPFNGVVYISKNNRNILKKAYGFADFENKTVLTTNSRFLIGSITKQFTALLIMQEVERGRIDLNMPISKYLKSYKNKAADNITIHHLLSHTSGLAHYEALYALGINQKTFFNSKLTVDAYVELISKMELITDPGERYYYSSMGYVLLGAILEELTGMSYRELIKTRITDVLNLKNTGYATNEELKRIIVKDYDFQEYYGLDYFLNSGSGSYTDSPFRDQSTTYSTGGLYSTVDDLYQWIHAIKTNQLLSKKYSDLMLKPNLEGYCYGFWRNQETWIRRNPAALHYQHGGGQTGFSSQMAFYDDGTTIIWLSNVRTVNTIKLTKNLYLAANNIELSEFKRDILRPEIEEDYDDFIEDGGLAAYKKYYQDISKRASYKVNPDAQALSELINLYADKDEIKAIVQEHFQNGLIKSRYGLTLLTYVLLDKEMLDLALMVSLENIKYNPYSSRAFDTLGEVYFLLSNKAKARQSFKKAVSLAEVSGSKNLNYYKDNYKKTIK